MATLKYRENASSSWKTLKALPQTGTVRYDLAQSLDTTQQRMARLNIGAAAASDVANAVEYEAQSGFTNLQRKQACENIGAVTYLMDQILNDTEKGQARKNIGATKITHAKTTIILSTAFQDVYTFPNDGLYLISFATTAATLNAGYVTLYSTSFHLDSLNYPSQTFPFFCSVVEAKANDVMKGKHSGGTINSEIQIIQFAE